MEFIDRWKKRNESRIKETKFTVNLFRHSLLSMVGLTLILFMVFIAIFAPFLAKDHPEYAKLVNPQGKMVEEQRWELHFDEKLEGPSWEHPLGTDDYGHDIYSMIVYGSRISIKIAIEVVLIATVVGVLLGSLAGYFGGKVDEIVMRITDIFFSIPYLILAMAFVAALGRSIEHVMWAMIIVWWPGYTRLIRGQVLKTREETYIEAARSLGTSDLKIVFRHILPNSFAPVFVQMTMDVGSVVLTAAGLSFIGLGAPPGTAEWGIMVSLGRTYIFQAYWYVTFPGIAIALFVLGFNLLGDGLRDVMDPKLRR
ncbi:MAG: ABC transporter permease [Euryarchaeota archaeon]|nr:ABC transporter permease [Euryarchaeota archaeon]